MKTRAELGFAGAPELCKARPCSSLMPGFVFLASKNAAAPNPALAVSAPGCFQTCWDAFMGMARLEWPSRLPEPLPAEPVGLWLLVWCPSPGSDSSQAPNLQELHLSVRENFLPWRAELGLPLSGVIPKPRGGVPVSPALGHLQSHWRSNPNNPGILGYKAAPVDVDVADGSLV